MDVEYANLPKAPIIEAIIDLQFVPSAVVSDPSVLAEQLRSACSATFPTPKNVQSWNAQLTFTGDAGPSLQSLARKRLRLDSADGLHVLQADASNFTFSRLKPYASWSDFFSQFLAAWKEYQTIYKPGQITQIAVRYINRFDFDDANIKLGDYFKTSPVVGVDLPIAGFLLQVTLHKQAIGAGCIVTEAAQPNPLGLGPSIILDINTFKQGAFSLDEPVLAAHLSDLQQFKNEMFFGSITDKALERFK
jgi:uncharacterized protein (TIGR04255 family)